MDWDIDVEELGIEGGRSIIAIDELRAAPPLQMVPGDGSTRRCDEIQFEVRILILAQQRRLGTRKYSIHSFMVRGGVNELG